MIDIPHVAEIMQAMARRPPWLVGTPFAVDSETFEIARNEIMQVQQARGFPLASDGNLDRDGIENFLIQGVPVVRSEP